MKNNFSTLAFVFFLGFILFNSCKPEVVKPEEEETPVLVKGDVDVWLTSGNEIFLLREQNGVDFSRELGDFTITIDSTQSYQSIDGFGAALTGSSAFLLKNLTADRRDSILHDLFDPNKGIGINYLRLTIGSSDFSIGTYSYCDTGNMNDFAIPEIDKRDLLPVLKEILAINPSIKILASPWSAPAWMKNNNSMYGGSLKGPSVYADFAEYFVKYVQAFEAEGIHIDAITIQNEPEYATSGYPTMKMLWTEQNIIIRDFLGPRFVAEGINTKIIIWDHNFDMAYYPMNILNDQDTRKYVDGVGWHGYVGNATAIDAITAAHPDKNVYFTEQSGGEWNTDTRMGNMFYYMKNFLMGSVNRGSKNFIMWNLVLNEDNGPNTTEGGCHTCRGVITVRDNGSYIRNEEYYLLGHYAKFVRLDAKRIYNSSSNLPSGINVSSFQNTDGTKTVVVMNRSGKRQSYNIRCGSRKFLYNQLNESVVTLYFK